jgi:putative photosynthetic complex assembly protein
LRREEEQAMSEQRPYRPFPRGPLLGAGVLVVLSLLLAAAGRFTGLGTSMVDPASELQTRDLRFEDRADGSVAVLEAVDHQVVEILAPGTNGFVRGVLRGLARERKLDGIGDAAPFRLISWSDGRLSLRDMATGREIQLVSFGQTQFDVFAAMLPPVPAKRSLASASHGEEQSR